MKVIDSFENLKLKNKIILFISTLLLIALVNFLFYNFHILTLPKAERIYEVPFTQSENQIQMHLESQYIQYLNIQYNAEHNFNINLKDTIYNDTCYSHLHTCGFVIRDKISASTFTIDQDVNILSIQVDNTLSFHIQTFAFWSILFTLLFVLVTFKSFWKKNIHLLAFLLCISIGSLFLICAHNMTSTTLDDDSHFNRINSFLPKSISDNDSEIYRVFFYFIKTPAEKQEYKNYLNENAFNIMSAKEPLELLNFSRINYYPMAITVTLARTIGVSFTTSFLLGRIVNLLIYAFVISFAIKLIPCYKLLTMFVALIPQSLYLASNYNYDPTVTAFALLSFAAFVYEYYHKEKKIECKSILIFVLAVLYAVLPKMVYVPILGLMLLLPKEKFKDGKQCLWFKIILCIVIFLCMATFILPTAIHPSSTADPRGGNTSESGQLTYILSNPIRFTKMFIKNAILTIPNQLVGPKTLQLFSYYNEPQLDLNYYIFIFVFLLAFLSEKNIPKVKNSHRLFIVVLCIGIVCLINLAMYISFTPVGLNQINGVQARYYIPLLLPLIFCLSNSNLKNHLKEDNVLILSTSLYLFSIFLLIYLTIVSSYCL